MKEVAMPASRRLPLASSFVAMLFAAAALSAAPSSGIAAEARSPFFRSITITKSGLFEQGSPIEIGAGATAVAVMADNVTVDCRGNAVKGPGGPGTVGIDIRGRRNVVVRNCIFDGLGIAVRASGATNVRVERSQIDGRDLGGMPPNVEIGVLLVNTRGASVVDNVITDTFLGVFVRGGGSGGNRIFGNTLAGGDHGMLGICYNPAEGEGPAGPDGDFVYNNLVSHFNTAIQISAGSQDNVFAGNTLAAFVMAVEEATPGSNVIEENHETTPAP
jgi:hypothetical protein